MQNLRYCSAAKMSKTFLLIAATTASLFAQAPPDLPGTIAYFRVTGATQTEPGTSELHLVKPDGSDDRIIYSTPRGLVSIYPVPGWRPDGEEIAFISAHEFGCSRFDSDIFGIRPDGSGLRRISNAPRCEDLAPLPKGSARVTIENQTLNASIFFIYIEGAAELQQATISPGFSSTLTINNIADLGRQQIVYVKSGSGTWFNPAAYVDIEPGQTVTAGSSVQITSGYGPFQLRINNFTWKGDGSEIAYIVEAGLRLVQTASPAPGLIAQDLFSGNAAAVSTGLAWSPVSDEFLYYSILASPNGIYRGARGSDLSTHTLVLEADFVDGITWLKDGSGFVFSITYSLGFSPNKIARYDFASQQLTVIKESFNIVGVVPSPDGRYLAFAQREDENSPFDLWGMTTDGNQSWKIADNITSWDWGPDSETPPGGALELQYDDGTATTGYNWPNAGQGSAVRFTTPSGSAKLLQAKFFYSSLNGGNQHLLRILGDNGGAPGATIFGPQAVTAPNAGWVTYDLSNANITVNGDFYVMIEYDGTNTPAFGSESTPPLNQRSWDFDGNSWTLFDSEDYLIRAVVQTATGVAEQRKAESAPRGFELAQNFPNPFNPATEIRYALPQAAQVKLQVFDVLGREVATLFEGLQNAGIHTTIFSAMNDNAPASGIYFYKLTAREEGNEIFTRTRKMLLVE